MLRKSTVPLLSGKESLKRGFWVEGLAAQGELLPPRPAGWLAVLSRAPSSLEESSFPAAAAFMRGSVGLRSLIRAGGVAHADPGWPRLCARLRPAPENKC